MAYNPAGSLLDQTTYDLTNLPEATASGGVTPAWQVEYTFTQQWGLPRVDLPSLARLYSLTEAAAEERERWHTLFPVSSQAYWPQLSSGGGGGEQAGQTFYCAFGNTALLGLRDVHF